MLKVITPLGNKTIGGFFFFLLPLHFLGFPQWACVFVVTKGRNQLYLLLSQVLRLLS